MAYSINLDGYNVKAHPSYISCPIMANNRKDVAAIESFFNSNSQYKSSHSHDSTYVCDIIDDENYRYFETIVEGVDICISYRNGNGYHIVMQYDLEDQDPCTQILKFKELVRAIHSHLGRELPSNLTCVLMFRTPVIIAAFSKIAMIEAKRMIKGMGLGDGCQYELRCNNGTVCIPNMTVISFSALDPSTFAESIYVDVIISAEKKRYKDLHNLAVSKMLEAPTVKNSNVTNDIATRIQENLASIDLNIDMAKFRKAQMGIRNE